MESRPSAPVLLDVSALLLRRAVFRERLAGFADFVREVAADPFARELLRDAVLLLFAFAVRPREALLLFAALRDFLPAAAFPRDALALERLPPPDRVLFAPPRPPAAAFVLPPVVRGFALRLLLPLRAAARAPLVLRDVRLRPPRRVVPVASPIPAAAAAPPGSFSSMS